MHRGILLGMGLAGMLALCGAQERPQGLGEAPGQVVLPEDVYQKLAQRLRATLQEELKASGGAGQKRARVAAVRLAASAAACARGRGEPRPLWAVQQRALQLAARLQAGESAAKIALLLKELEQPTPASAPPTADWHAYLDVSELMDVYRPRSKGGEGLAAVLQTTGPLRKQNGIEEKIRYLVRKELKAEQLAKEAEELRLLGYELAVDAALTAELCPKAQAARAAAWRRWAQETERAAQQLAAAAEHKEARQLQQAARALDQSCTQCHKEFRQ
jgi:hypothetical protein